MSETVTRVFCPECEREFAAGHEVCPEDGASLMAYEVVETDESEDPLLGETLDERFRIDEPISEGGMGKVYLGSQVGVDREVAVKVLHSDVADDETVIKRFLREARTISGFAHPNIVNFIDFGQNPEHQVLYLVMELIDGVELGELLTRGRLRVEFAVEVAHQVCSALSEPHHNGVVHRDLKPANLMLLPLMDGSLQVKVVDFGIANAMQSQTRLTQTGAVCGTPHYMAPEQARGEETRPATDMYALGAILYHMINGEAMFDADKSVKIMFMHASEPAPRLQRFGHPDTLPEDLVALYRRLVAKDPEERPKSVREVRSELGAVQRACEYGEIRLDPEVPNDEVFDDWLIEEEEPKSAPRPRPETGANAERNQTNDARKTVPAREDGGEGLENPEPLAETAEQRARGARETPEVGARISGPNSERASPTATKFDAADDRDPADRSTGVLIAAAAVLLALLLLGGVLAVLMREGGGTSDDRTAGGSDGGAKVAVAGSPSGNPDASTRRAAPGDARTTDADGPDAPPDVDPSEGGRAAEESVAGQGSEESSASGQPTEEVSGASESGESPGSTPTVPEAPAERGSREADSSEKTSTGGPPARAGSDEPGSAESGPRSDEGGKQQELEAVPSGSADDSEYSADDEIELEPVN